MGSMTVVELSVQKLLHKFVSYVESPPLFFAAEALVYGMGMVCAAYSLSGRLNSNIKSGKVLVRNIFFCPITIPLSSLKLVILYPEIILN